MIAYNVAVMKQQTAVVIGAGFGGLSVACYLAKAGYEVTVVEKNNQPGGRAMTLEAKGFMFDMGPSWYMMPDVFDEFFADFGKRSEDYYDLVRLDPSYKVFTADKSYLVPSAPEVFDYFESIEKGAGKKLAKLLGKTEKEYGLVREKLLPNSMLGPKQSLNKTALSLLRNPELVRSYHSRIKKYIKNKDLQKILEFMVVFMGGSPKNIPALYSLLTHVDMGLGIHYPMGGMNKVPLAYESLARDLGVAFHYGVAVSSIETKNKSVSTVHLADGGFYHADVVVANADYHFVENELLDKSERSFSEKYWQKRTMSPSGLLMYIGVKNRLPNLEHHNLFFDTDWNGHFKEVFDKKVWSNSPMFYLCVPSITDESVAPKGSENLFVLAPLANGLIATEERMEKTANAIIDRIEQKIGTSFRKQIVVKDVRAHDYFKETFNAYKGNAFGLAHTMKQTAFLRPPIRSKKVKGLYYVGQYTNPGTGVPIVTLSGKVVANQVVSDGRA